MEDENENILADSEDEESLGEQNKISPADRLKPWQFKPGQSGNPSGRPKGVKSLKEYAKEMLASMTDDERQEFMKGLNKDIIWQMAEGKPAQDITSAGERLIPTPILGGISNEVHTNNSPEKDIGIEETH